jgi:hypothetical protein
VRALSIGPAASLALSAGTGALRVHGVFPSTVNLEVEGTQRFVSLCGPRGGCFPHAVVLERPEDLDSSRLAAGVPARLAGGSIQLLAEDGPVTVDLERAEQSPPRALSAIHGLGKAHRACATRLAEIQREARCDLRIETLGGGGATTALGASLRDAAVALSAAARAFARTASRYPAGSGLSRCGGSEPRSPLRHATAALVGLGAGLTPSGDDFLCGFMAAARASCPALVGALNDAAGSNAGRTGAISAFLVRCAIEGFWPTPLVDLADALGREQEAESLAALGDLCGLGHSSGCDIATGFLFGLESLLAARESAR